jgi:hypothetical protein
MDKKVSPLCRQCDYGPLTHFLSENKKLLLQRAAASENELERGATYARTKINGFAESPSIVTTQWNKFYWNCHCCKLLQVRKVIIELEAEVKAKEEENPMYYWGVAMVVATAKVAAQSKDKS